jgi:hypothetical protein
MVGGRDPRNGSIDIFFKMRYILLILLFCSCIPLEHTQTGIGQAVLKAREKAKDTTPIHIERRWNWLRDVPAIHTP